MAMKTENKIYIALSVLALLGGGVFLTQKQQKKEQQRYFSSGSSANIPELKVSGENAEKITKLEIKNADKSEVTLEKSGEEWKVTKPVEYAANQANVKSTIDNLKELKGKEVIDSSAGSYGEYSVDDGKAVHVVAYKGSEKIIDLYFGKSGGRGQMVRKAGTDGVFAVSGYSSYQFTREVKSWRDNEIAKFDEAAPVKIEIKNENGDFSFIKEGESWAATNKGKKIDRYDDSKVKDMVRALKSLTAEDFADGKSDTDTGLDKPAATLVISLKEGTPIKLLVGKTAAGENRYARKEGVPQVFVLSSWTAGWAVAKADKFQKPEEKKDGSGGASSSKDEKKDKK